MSTKTLPPKNSTPEKPVGLAGNLSTIPTKQNGKTLSDQIAPKRVHITLQGKGGVGKSLISSLLMQYLLASGQEVAAIDTDPVNSTLAGYKAFHAKHLKLIEDGAIVTRNFDTLIEQIVAEDKNFVVDNGASSFIPLSYYMAENEVVDLLTDNGKQVFIHTVVTGGQAMDDTLFGLSQLVKQMPKTTKIIVWLNEFFGDIAAQGKTFEEMQVYQNHKARIHGIVRIARQSSDTFAKDMQLMLDAKMTFDEVQKSDLFTLMPRSRLARVKKAIFSQLDGMI